MFDMKYQNHSANSLISKGEVSSGTSTPSRDTCRMRRIKGTVAGGAFRGTPKASSRGIRAINNKVEGASRTKVILSRAWLMLKGLLTGDMAQDRLNRQGSSQKKSSIRPKSSIIYVTV